MKYSELPGGELLIEGIRDLQSSKKSSSALLLMIGAPRLRRHGIELPEFPILSQPVEHELYDMLQLEFGAQAYQRYNSLIGLLVSLENALALMHSIKQK